LASYCWRNMSKIIERRLPKDGSIDAGLDVLGQIGEPGQTFSCGYIGRVCGCHRGYISMIQRAALRKLRRALAREVGAAERGELEGHLR